MNVKSIMVLLASGLYLFTCHYWYCCTVKAACYGCAVPATEMVAPAIAKKAVAPLLFNWSNATPLTTTDFGKEKTKWLNGKSDDNLLEITGIYHAEETPPEEFQNMGLARADAVRKLLILELPDERIRLNSKLRTKVDQNKEASFDAIQVKWIPIGNTGSEVIDFGQKAMILFPSNSIKKESNKSIDDYLKATAKKVKVSGQTIFITGHTDNAGSIEANQRLAQKRAMRIRRILRQKGVSREQIVVNAKGEQEPIASNETEAGRYQNRRVILELR